MEIDQSIELKINNLFDKAIIILATGLFSLAILLASIQVVVRQTGILPSEWFVWTVPLARFVLIVMTYIGGAAVARNNEHISISIILDRLGQRTPRLRTALSLITDVVVVVFLGMALYGTYLNTVNYWKTPVGGISGIMSGYIYFGIGLGVFAMIIYEIDDAVESTKSILAGLRRKSAGNEEVREHG